MSQTVVLKVRMSCQGCSGAVERVLAKMEGVESYDINMEHQKVTVKGHVVPQAVFEKVSKTGKKTEFWQEKLETKESAPVEAPPAEPSAKAPSEVVDTPIAAAKESAPIEVPAAEPSVEAPSEIVDTPIAAAKESAFIEVPAAESSVEAPTEVADTPIAVSPAAAAATSKAPKEAPAGVVVA